MHELIKRDIAYKAAAILLAVLLWFYVTNLQNPTIEKVLSGVPVSYYGLKEGLVTGDRPQNIELKVKGPRSLINPLTSKDIKASVDLTQAKMGEGNYPVQVTLPAGVELIYNKTPSIHLRIDAIQEKQLAVQVKMENTVAQGYASFEPVLTPSRVVVKGPLQLLANLDSARVTVDLNQATENLVLNVPVNIVDKWGNLVQGNALDINPKSIQVFIPVIKNSPTKTVPVKPVLSGKPAEGFQVARIILEPETVKITGPYDRLNLVDHVPTQPIDISGIQQNLVTQVTLSSPEGISLLYDPTVKVLIQVETGPVSKQFNEIPVNKQNQQAGTRVMLKPEKISITVRGSQEEIAKLKAEDIKALVDLAGLTPGTHQLEVKVDISNKLQVLKVEPNKVEVTISNEG